MSRLSAAAFSRMNNSSPMDKTVNRISTAALLVMAMLSVFVSCVNEEYEVSEDRVNLEVTVFQDGVTIPLGNTAPIKLKDLVSLLDEEYRRYFEAGDNGLYSIYYADSYDLSDSLSAFKDMLKIDDVSFAQDFPFSLSDVDVSGVKIDAFDYVFDKSLSEDFAAPEMPSVLIEMNSSSGAGLSGFSFGDMTLMGEQNSISHESSIIDVPEDYEIPEILLNDNEVSLQTLVNLVGEGVSIADAFGPESYEMSFQMTFPKGIRSIEEVVMKENARIGVTVEMTNSLFTGGYINPHLDLDVHNIFHLTDHTSDETVGMDHILADFRMEAVGGREYNEYGVESIILNEEDWRYDENGCLVLDKTVKLEISGHPEYEGVVTTTRHVAECGYRSTPVRLTVDFLDFEVDYVKAVLDPIEVEKTEKVAFDLPAVTLPEGMASVDYVEFSEDSQIGFSLSVDNAVPGLGLKMKSLQIMLPEGMEAEGAEDGRILYENVDVTAGFHSVIKIEKFTLPEPVDGKISLSDYIEVTACTVAEGTVTTSDLPASEADDMRLDIDVEGRLEISDYQATIEGYEYPVNFEEQIEEEVPSELADMGDVVIYPDGDPVIVIDITLPETGLPVGPVGDGVAISFPKMLRFKNVSSEYDFESSDNTLVFKDKLPSRVELPIDRLVIAPVKEGDKCFIRGDISVDGNVGVGSCVVDKAVVDGLSDMKVALAVHVPELTPSRLSLGHYTASITQDAEITLLEPGQIPAEIVSVGRIELSDTYADIHLDASSLPDLGDAELKLDFAVGLPDLLVLADGLRDESGLVHISGSLDKDGKIAMDPVRIEAIDLSGTDLKSADALVEKLSIDGTVMLSNAELSLDDWMDKEHSVSLSAAIRNLDIARVSGKVDAGIDPVAESVDLSVVKSYIDTDNIQATVDLEHVHLSVDLETNLGISAMAQAEIIPYYDGNASEPVKVDLEVKAADSPEQPRKTRYWLGDKEECCPAGYEFKEIPLLDLIRNIPDSVKVSVAAGTDPDEECVIYPSADYILKLDYALDVPMKLGDEFRFEFRDTLSGIPPVISTIFRGGDLVLAGEVESSLPFDLDLKANLLDADGNVIGLSEDSARQVIMGCAVDGSPVKSDLRLAMIKKDGMEIPDIAAVELYFVAASSVAGAPVTEDTFIKATLQALVPKGINVDLREIINEEGEEQ